MASCKLNEIFLGEVASVQVYGAFIRIPGCSQQGLLHKSQLSSTHVDDVADILQKGDRIWCKVISLGDNGKIGLSMKYVNQGNGTDLDPNGVDQQRDAQKRRVTGRTEKKAIHLEAVLNTTCTKCGTHGHLSRDCFMTPDGKKYELIPEIEEKSVAQEDEVPEVPVKTKEKDKEKSHKQKKLKKKKAKKHKHEASDNEDSSDNKKMSKKKKKKYSKDVKKKKKEYNSSSSEDSSNSSSSHDIKAHKRKSTDDTRTHAKKSKRSKH